MEGEIMIQMVVARKCFVHLDRVNFYLLNKLTFKSTSHELPLLPHSGKKKNV
jgi:hypothetical protein